MKNVMLVMVLAMFSGGCVTKRFIEAKPMIKETPKPIKGIDYIRPYRASLNYENYSCPVSGMDATHRKLYQENKAGF